MLFYVAWKPRAGISSDQQKKAFEMFARWTPPTGLDIKQMYALVDGRGFCVCDCDTAATAYAAMAPWAAIYNDYDIVPIVEMAQGVELLNAAFAFRDGS